MCLKECQAMISAEADCLALAIVSGILRVAIASQNPFHRQQWFGDCLMFMRFVWLFIPCNDPVDPFERILWMGMYYCHFFQTSLSGRVLETCET